MEESTRLSDSTLYSRKHVMSETRQIYVDDESSTDSGCSSRGISESHERLSRRESADRLCGRTVGNPHESCYLHRVHGHQLKVLTSHSHDRLSSTTNSANNRNSRSQSSRSWSPSEERGKNHNNHHQQHHHHRHHSRESPSHSSSPSDAHSSDSDSFKRPSKTEVIKRTLQRLKIAKWQENSNNHNNNIGKNNAKEKTKTMNSPRRILRDPVSYTYVRGLSGLPTQRVPRISGQQTNGTCGTIGYYR